MDSFKKVGNLDDETWEKVMAVNLTGPMKLIRAAIPNMINNGGGNIVTIASVGGLYGKVSGAAYTASKHGVIGLAKNTAWMYKEDNIRSNIIAPGGVETEIASSMNPETMDMGGYKKIDPFVQVNPKTGQPDEIANLALFLASDESSLINGVVVEADGGWTL